MSEVKSGSKKMAKSPGHGKMAKSPTSKSPGTKVKGMFKSCPNKCPVPVYLHTGFAQS